MRAAHDQSRRDATWKSEYRWLTAPRADMTCTQTRRPRGAAGGGAVARGAPGWYAKESGVLSTSTVVAMSRPITARSFAYDASTGQQCSR